MPDSTVPAPPAGPAPQPQPAPPSLATAAVPRENFFQKAEGWFHNADKDVQALAAKAPGIDMAIRDHAGQVLDVAGDFLALAKIADPAIAPALIPVSAALAALEAKVLAMTQSAVAIAGKLAGSGSKSA